MKPENLQQLLSCDRFCLTPVRAQARGHAASPWHSAPSREAPCWQGSCGGPCVPAALLALLVLCELASTVAEKLCWRFPGAGGREGLFYFQFSDAACLEGVKSICL